MLDVLRVWAESAGWEPRISICQESNVDLDTEADVVGFSVYTQTAPAIYRAADELRKRGKVVFLGGPHFRGSSTVAEAAPHCDVIAGSLCEDQMRELLAEVRSGSIRSGQPARVVRDREGRFRYPRNFYQSLRNRRWFQIPTISTSLGCPYDCDFCAAYMQGEYHLRDIETVRNEVASVPGKLILFSDASFGLNRSYTLELMDALAPLEKKIAVETTLARLRDPTLLAALAHGGVRWLVVGVETLDLKLRKHGSVDLEQSLGEVIDRSHALGMMVQGNFICGLDGERPDSFAKVHDYYVGSTLDAIMIGIVTPYPDTGLYRRLDREGRIFDRDWSHYDGHHVVYRPDRMSVDDLIDGYIELYGSIRRYRSFGREVVQSLRAHGVGLESLSMVGNNLYQKFDSLKKERHLRRNQRMLAQTSLHLTGESAPGLV